MIQFHGLLLLFIQEYPQIVEDIDKTVQTFIEDPSSRTKTHTPQLGLYLVYAIFSSKYSLADIIEPYFSESLDRQVMWILKKIPELEDATSTQLVDSSRIEVTFATTVISCMLVCFTSDYTRVMNTEFSKSEELLSYLESHFCKIARETEDLIQDKFQDATENMKNYQMFFARVGMKVRTNEEINKMLKQAVINSREKNYHGDVDDVIGLGSITEQTKNFTSLTTSLDDFIKDGKIVDASDDEWKTRCLKRWTWMSHNAKINYQEAMTAKSMAKIVDTFDHSLNIKQTGLDVSSNTYYSKKNKGVFNKYRHSPQVVVEYSDSYTWVQLYAKIDIEECIRLLNYRQDFSSLYSRIDAAKDLLEVLQLFVTPCTNLKSGYYYLCSVLGKLSKLRVLKLRGSEVTVVQYKALNNIRKGLVNLKKVGCVIEKISIRALNFSGRQSEDAITQLYEDLDTL